MLKKVCEAWAGIDKHAPYLSVKKANLNVSFFQYHAVVLS